MLKTVCLLEMACDPLQSVRRSCEDVMKHATDVSIDDDKLQALAKELSPNSSFNPFVAFISLWFLHHEHSSNMCVVF